MRSISLVLLALVTAVTATLLALPRPAAPDLAAPDPESEAAHAPGSTAAAAPGAWTQPPAPVALMPDPTRAGLPTSAQISRGARTYRTLCVACHLPDGKGMATVTPPLAGADFMLADRERAVRTVLKGLAGPITVNGIAYQGVMPALEHILTDAQVADVLTYVFNTWGNRDDAFAAAHIAELRAVWRDEPGVPAPPSGGQ